MAAAVPARLEAGCELEHAGRVMRSRRRSALAEVDAADLGVGADLVRAALGDEPAMVQDHEALGTGP